MLCMAHVLNLSIQVGLKELSNLSLIPSCPENGDDESVMEDSQEVNEQRDFLLFSKTCTCNLKYIAKDSSA